MILQTIWSRRELQSIVWVQLLSSAPLNGTLQAARIRNCYPALLAWKYNLNLPDTKPNNRHDNQKKARPIHKTLRRWWTRDWEPSTSLVVHIFITYQYIAHSNYFTFFGGTYYVPPHCMVFLLEFGLRKRGLRKATRHPMWTHSI